MNGLYPIIRRKRRPLLPEESVPDRPPAGSVPASVPASVPDGRAAGAAEPVVGSGADGPLMGGASSEAEERVPCENAGAHRKDGKAG